MRHENAMTALVLETVIEVGKDSPLNDTHLDICRTALNSLR
jgi:hypothetical protein